MRVFKNLFGDGSKIHADEIARKVSRGTSEQAVTLDLAVVESITLPNNINLNDIVTSGFYRVGASPVNGPSTSVAYGQMIVCRGGDTILQIAARHQDARLFVRTGRGQDPVDPNKIAEWTNWREI